MFDIKEECTFYRVYNILKRLSDRKAAFEINNGLVGTLINKGYLNVYADLIRELKKSGVKFSRGSDSHCAIKVGEWDNAETLVDLAGIVESDWIKPVKWSK